MQTKVTNLQRALDAEGIEALVARTMKKQNAIDANRKNAFGKSGGLMKSLLDKGQQGDRDLKSTFEWMQAALENDTSYLRRAQSKYSQNVNDAWNAGELSALEFKTLSPAVEGTNSAGGYNVPLPFAAELSRNLGNYGYCRKYFRQIAIERKEIAIAGLNTKPSIAWVSENATIPASKPELDQLLLVAEKVAAIYPASNEYLADANIDVLAAIIEIFGEQFGIAEDTMGFSDQNTIGAGMLYYGDGTLTTNGGLTDNGAIGQWLGGSSASGKVHLPDAVWEDYLEMLAPQPSALFQGGMYFLPQEAVLNQLRAVDSQARPLANIINNLEIVTGLDGQPQLTLFHYPVVVLPMGIMVTWGTASSPSTPFAVMCNPMRSWMCMGIRGGFEVDMSISATADSVNAFTNDLKLFRLKERVSFGCGRPNTITVLRTSAT